MIYRIFFLSSHWWKWASLKTDFTYIGYIGNTEFSTEIVRETVFNEDLNPLHLTGLILDLITIYRPDRCIPEKQV